jgi:hypothetical protein
MSFGRSDEGFGRDKIGKKQDNSRSLRDDKQKNDGRCREAERRYGKKTDQRY